MRYLALFAYFLSFPLYAAPQIGSPVANFTLSDSWGNPVELSDFLGKHVVLEWINPDCPAVKRHYELKTMQNLAYEYLSYDVVWLSINSTHYMTQEDNQRWRQLNQIFYRILDDREGLVGQALQAQITPQVFILDPQGTLVYKGAVDNAPQGVATFNYVEAALQELLTDQPITYPETQAYGCAVKYPAQMLNLSAHHLE
ncbi:redoxin domain-containing protein [Candidatus Albibeggiatoa sp. nov. NOAA]|uniref:redoxin domain-containing protein n=1 Tax=Candidatus Albibeggiatoa sp. nov. NOAA TaxID=3162724 RepID=UPI0032F87BFC|nr:redoxin domain-containing protein [Thiotrichaceae bacterium]